MAEQSTESGTLGILRMIGVLGVLALAMIAAGFVLDFIPRESFQEYATKIVVLVAIGAITVVAIMALVRMGRR